MTNVQKIYRFFDYCFYVLGSCAAALVIYALLTGSVAWGHDLPLEEGTGVVERVQSRPSISLGYGPIIDDLEAMSDGTNGYNGRPHTMRNLRDKGNWVHEMTHLVNSQLRNASMAKHKDRRNTAYVLNRMAMTITEPGVRLSQVAKMVPPAQRGGAYKTYLVDACRWWDEQSLNVLDEAVAAGNALWYQITVRESDDHRQGLAEQFTDYSSVLLAAVKKHDPNYTYLPQLEGFIKWHNRRLKHLIWHHKSLDKPYTIGAQQ